MKRQAITAEMKLATLRRFRVCAICWLCMKEFELSEIEFDHHLALVDGGEHTVDNLRPLCIKCHAKKSAREHSENCRAKRRAKAKEVHDAVVKRVMTRPPGKIKSKGFTHWRDFDGKIKTRKL